jgi:type IV fimbrial biogenesis protein FimT
MNASRRHRFVRTGCQRGFTLIELAVTVGVLGVMMSLAAPTFISFQHNSELTSTANSFMSALSAARAEAMKRQLNTYVIPVDGMNWSSGWTVYVDSNFSQSYDSGDVLITSHAAIPSTIVSQNDTLTGNAAHYVEFSGAGFAITNANAPALSGGLDFYSAAVNQKRRVLVDPAGRMRVCDPNDTTQTGCAVTTLNTL